MADIARFGVYDIPRRAKAGNRPHRPGRAPSLVQGGTIPDRARECHFMICQRCERSLGNRTVCVECKIPLRPKSLLVASVLELLVGILSLGMGNVILAIVNGVTGFFLLRVSRLAIGIAGVLALIGLVLNGILITTGGGEALLTAEGLREVDSRAIQVAALGQGLIHLAILICLLRPDSRRAFALAGMDEAAMDTIIAREDERARVSAND